MHCFKKYIPEKCFHLSSVKESVNYLLGTEVILGTFKWYIISSQHIHSPSISTTFSDPETDLYGVLWLPNGLANKES